MKLENIRTQDQFVDYVIAKHGNKKKRQVKQKHFVKECINFLNMFCSKPVFQDDETGEITNHEWEDFPPEVILGFTKNLFETWAVKLQQPKPTLH